MHQLIAAIVDCLTCHPDHNDAQEEKLTLDFPPDKAARAQTTEALASDLLSTLYDAKHNDEHLAQSLQDIVRETGWYENLAEALLNGLEKALETGAPMGEAMRNAYERSAAEVTGFVKQHPVFCAVVALGILVILAPWAIEALGFGELGPIEGE